MTYTAKPFIIKTKTNLHVGSESINYDIVDKTVQRDSISDLPVINASSMKGAIRSHFSELKLEEEYTIDLIFGNEEDQKNKKASQQGTVKFVDSYLLFLPLRSNTKAFYHTTSKEQLEAFCSFYEDFGFEMQEFRMFIGQLNENVVLNAKTSQVEDVECANQEIDSTVLKSIFPNVKNLAILSSENFNDAVKHLPVIARNKLKDSKSTSLWYEEIVPRESVFYTTQLVYGNFANRMEGKVKHHFETFYETLQKGFIQLGANASIGFGLCSFKMLPLEQKEEEKNV